MKSKTCTAPLLIAENDKRYVHVHCCVLQHRVTSVRLWLALVWGLHRLRQRQRGLHLEAW